MNTVYILGRQPDLGIAELESLLGEANIRKVDNSVVASAFEPNYIPFSRLGGSMKVGQIIATLPFSDWNKIESYIFENAPKAIQYLGITSKINLGVSVYGIPVSAQKINASGLKLKKIIKHLGVSVRVVPNKTAQLNSAQVIHNKLIGSGWELLVIKDGQQTILAQTVNVQDIEAYSARDQARPFRDAKVGMLPPKLAQIIINLASVGNNRFGATVLDPFCGTGVLIQEACLMGFKGYGTDIEPRMVEYTDKNMSWLSGVYADREIEWNAEVGDAINHKWTNELDFVAAETYLGRPLTQIPDKETLNKIISDCDFIHKKFLKNIAEQTKPGFRMCIAVPSWINGNQILHLKTLDYLEELGYTRQSFVHANNRRLIYYREGQKVGRELVVITRK
jgi:tRNA G10  N-methylase Trm11